MKIAKSLAAGALFAAVSFGAPAFAADVSAPVSAVAVLEGGENFFGSTWYDLNSNAGDTFTNRYLFSVTGTPADLAAFVGSASPDAARGLDITGMSVYSAADNSLVGTGVSAGTAEFDWWRLEADSLAIGNYYVQVSGTIVGNEGGAFAGTLALAPVPEPETYGMMLAGLGLLGFMAKRRRDAKQ